MQRYDALLKRRKEIIERYDEALKPLGVQCRSITQRSISHPDISILLEYRGLHRSRGMRLLPAWQSGNCL
ncbi:MAG: hypothetical protein ACLSB9_15980 [Hydrogeniiclostridium mannosilyticum]